MITYNDPNALDWKDVPYKGHSCCWEQTQPPACGLKGEHIRCCLCEEKNASKNLEEKPTKEYWLTPPEVYKKLDDEFHFDFDPCPYPWDGVDGTETEWGNSVYLNPPFRKADGKNGKGPTAFIRKAIEENKKGKNVVVMINTNAFINMLIEAGAELRSMGRVKWLDGKTGEPWKSPGNTTCFILRGTPKTWEERFDETYKGCNMVGPVSESRPHIKDFIIQVEQQAEERGIVKQMIPMNDSLIEALKDEDSRISGVVDGIKDKARQEERERILKLVEAMKFKEEDKTISERYKEPYNQALSDLKQAIQGEI